MEAINALDGKHAARITTDSDGRVRVRFTYGFAGDAFEHGAGTKVYKTKAGAVRAANTYFANNNTTAA